MSLVVYVGIDKFKAESVAAVREQNATEITLSDIAKGQPSISQDSIDDASASESPSLVLAAFNEEASATLEHWLRKDTTHECIIAWPHPSAWLAASLQAERRPKEALWQWSYQADLILKLYKTKRRQITLIGYVPSAPVGEELPLVVDLSLEHIAPLYRLMASQLTQEDSLLQQAHNYLKASSSGTASWQMPAVDMVEQSLHYLSCEQRQHQTLETQLHAVKTELTKAQESSEQLTQQLAQVKEEHINEQSRSQKAQKQVTEVSQRLSEKNAQLLETEKAKDQLQNHAHSVEKENAALLEQLTSVQQAIEENTAEHQQQNTKLEQEKARLQKHVHSVEKEKAALLEQLTSVQQTLEKSALEYRQKSSKLEQEQARLQKHVYSVEKENAALLEQLTSVQQAIEENTADHQQQNTKLEQEKARLQDHAHGMEEENAALLEQLMKVQEALEQTILKNQQQSEGLGEKEVKLNWLRNKTKRQQEKLEEYKQAISQLKKESKEKDQHAQALKASISKLEKAATLTAEKHSEELGKVTASAKLKEQQLIEKVQQAHKLQTDVEKQANQLQKDLTALEAEKVILIEQLHGTQETLAHEQNAKEAVLKDKTVLDKQLTAQEKAAKQQQRQFEKERSEKALIVAQLHDVQEQLIQTAENHDHFKQQAETRQKALNVLKQQYQLERHQYESVLLWLRVSGHRNAAAAYRYSRPFKRALPQQVSIINESAFFDAQWYYEQYPDVQTSGIAPAEHYLKFGAIEGRNPSDKFDTYFYLSEYPDVAESGQNPLLHYLRHGQHEERLPARPQQQLPAPHNQ
ncbi:hypothetical protein J4377_11735 [Halomonas sp. XH26]|uniref:hypothetical protein n=1 Tax=Halomonas sp. XH26 TaxID=2557993 RepID=UPI00209F666E|nr:hypothetical protein [Halomonas sp. XH26]UTA78637.1 hypothetical protein J4377_11735 [Halomonas sp. XH26]